MNIQIELTNHCNLSCVECPNRLMKRKRQHMRWDVINAIITDYIVPMEPECIILHKDGEPLLHPEFSKIAYLISWYTNSKLDVYTNGLFLSQEFIKRLGSISNPVRVLISFHFENADGTQNNYEKKSLSIESMIEAANGNIEFVLATHLIREEDRSHREQWKERWTNFAARKNVNITGVHIGESINPWAGLISVGHLSTFVECPYSDAAHLFVGCTGNVLPCCMDLEEEIVFGNILKDEVSQIMEARDAFYTKTREHIIEHDLCRRCLGTV